MVQILEETKLSRNTLANALMDHDVSTVKRCMILRGIPGIGKTTLALELMERIKSEGKRCVIASADDSHIVDGVYKYDPSKQGQAHAECMASFLVAMDEGVDVVIVDNTNTRLWEFQHYIIAAEMTGYTVEIIERRADTIAQVSAAAARNKHGVPLSIIAQMAVQFENL